jgi:hypothetical protein
MTTTDDVHSSGRGALLHDARGREGERALVTLPVCSPPAPGVINSSGLFAVDVVKFIS